VIWRTIQIGAYRRRIGAYREEEIVLKALAEGLKDAEIEEFLLDPNDGSIESYVQSILARLGLSSRAELLLYAHSHGLTAKST
jgi:DNA-binding NarL/FixJ family response regulator